MKVINQKLQLRIIIELPQLFKQFVLYKSFRKVENINKLRNR